MRSLKHQILILLLGSLVLLAACFLTVLGWYMKDRVVAAAIIKVQTDLATCEEIIDKTYPGSWSVQDGNLYKGPTKVSLNNNLVDYLSRLTGDTVTLFLGDTRVATTVVGSNGERAIGTRISENVAHTVLNDGQTYVGEANVLGQWYQTGYAPLRAENGNIIGVFYVGISHAYGQEIITRSLITMAELGLFLTLLVALITWFFIQKVIIRPLHTIMLGTRDVATGHNTPKVKVSGAKEIGELEEAFNQMVEQFQSFAGELNRANGSRPKTDPLERDLHRITDLPEGNKKIMETTTESSGIVVQEQAQKENQTQTQDQEQNQNWDRKPDQDQDQDQTYGPDTTWCTGEEGLPKGLNQATLAQILHFLKINRRPLSSDDVAEGVKLTRVTVRRYLEFLEQEGMLKSELKYGTVGRPVKMFIPL